MDAKDNQEGSNLNDKLVISRIIVNLSDIALDDGQILTKMSALKYNFLTEITFKSNDLSTILSKEQTLHDGILQAPNLKKISVICKDPHKFDVFNLTRVFSINSSWQVSLNSK